MVVVVMLAVMDNHDDSDTTTTCLLMDIPLKLRIARAGHACDKGALHDGHPAGEVHGHMTCPNEYNAGLWQLGNAAIVTC